VVVAIAVPVARATPRQGSAAWRRRGRLGSSDLLRRGESLESGPDRRRGSRRVRPDGIAEGHELRPGSGEERDGVERRREGDAGRLEDLGPPGGTLLDGGEGRPR